jgi:hypothetical protein
VAAVAVAALEAVEPEGLEAAVMEAVVLAQQPLHRMELLIQAVVAVVLM